MVAPLHNRDANAYAQGAPDTLNGGVQEPHAAALDARARSIGAVPAPFANPPVVHPTELAPGTERSPCMGERAFTPSESAPYQWHSATSKAAAAAILRRMPELRLCVLAVIEGAEGRGMTDEEIGAAMADIRGNPLNPSTVRPRRGELADERWIVKAPFTRPSKESGRAMTVWLFNHSRMETSVEAVDTCVAPYAYQRPGALLHGNGATASPGMVPAGTVSPQRAPSAVGGTRPPDSGNGANQPAQIDLDALMTQLQERE